MAMTCRVRVETQRTRCRCVYTRLDAWVSQDQWKKGPSDLRRTTRQIPTSRTSRLGFWGRSMWGIYIYAWVRGRKERGKGRDRLRQVFAGANAGCKLAPIGRGASQPIWQVECMRCIGVRTHSQYTLTTHSAPGVRSLGYALWACGWWL